MLKASALQKIEESSQGTSDIEDFILWINIRLKKIIERPIAIACEDTVTSRKIALSVQGTQINRRILEIIITIES
jgi:hypothetical protein